MVSRKTEQIDAHIILRKLLTTAEYAEFEKHDHAIQDSWQEYYAKTTPLIPAHVTASFRGFQLQVSRYQLRFCVTKDGQQYYYWYMAGSRRKYMLLNNATSFAQAVAAVAGDPTRVAEAAIRADCGQTQWISRATEEQSGNDNIDGAWMFHRRW